MIIPDKGMPKAAIFLADKILVAAYQPAPHEPHSATTQLIQGIYELYPEHAQSILRQPIILNYHPRILCRGMISIAAKRFRINENLEELLSSDSRPRIRVSYTLMNDREFVQWPDFEKSMLWLRDINAHLHSDNNSIEPRFKRSRPVRAFLADHHGRIMGLAENENSVNKTKHAEVVLLQQEYQLNPEPLHHLTHLYTSLQCCKMCAAMYWHRHQNPWLNLKSFYLRIETGSGARDTILTPGGNLRREIAKDEAERSMAFEFLFDPNQR